MSAWEWGLTVGAFSGAFVGGLLGQWFWGRKR